MGPLAVFGITNDGLNLAVNLLLLFLVVLWLALVYWTYSDARRRIDDPMLVGCATAASLFPFVGTIVYTIVRPPEYLEDARERELEIAAAEARLARIEQLSCPYCSHEIESTFLRCPTCLHRLKEPCATCGKPLDPRWRICPYCEAEVGAPAPQPARRERRAQPRAQQPAQTPARDASTREAPPVDGGERAPAPADDRKHAVTAEGQRAVKGEGQRTPKAEGQRVTKAEGQRAAKPAAQRAPKAEAPRPAKGDGQRGGKAEGPRKPKPEGQRERPAGQRERQSQRERPAGRARP